MRMDQVGDRNKISWVLSYIQGGVAEIWKDNILDEIAKGTSVVQIVEQLYAKIRQEFGEFDEESRKVDGLRVLEQGEKTIDVSQTLFSHISTNSSTIPTVSIPA